MIIIWTRHSEVSLDEILIYIENKFGVLVAGKYYFEVLKTVEDIGINSEIFPIYKDETATRKAVINRKTILYYKIQDEKIFLLAFYDVRKGFHKL